MDSFDVGWIVQRRELYAILDCTQHVVVDHDRMGEVFATMHDSMSNGMNVCNALDRINRSVRTSPTKNELDSALSVANRRCRQFLFVTLRLQRDDGFTADSLDGPTRKSLIGIASNGVQ